MDQAIGVLFFNMAVSLALRGDLSGARQLLIRAAPSLLVDERNPVSRATTIWQGSEDHHRLLFPNDAVMDALIRVLNGRTLPRQFLRFWIYLDMREGKTAAAMQFLRMHLGDVMFGMCGSANQRVDPWTEGGGGGGGRGIFTQQETFGGQATMPIRPTPVSHSMLLQVQEQTQPQLAQPTPRLPQPQPPPPGLPRWTDADWPPLKEW